jgi:hypothetical protein
VNKLFSRVWTALRAVCACIAQTGEFLLSYAAAIAQAPLMPASIAGLDKDVRVIAAPGRDRWCLSR